MSTEIEQRVVQMHFDNKAFEKNTRETMSTLDKLKEKLRFDKVQDSFSEISKSASKVNLSPISNATESIRFKFSALEVAAVTAMANITNSVVNAGKRMISQFTVKPITDGFSEYELKMNSVQTIMASTGEDINVVNKYLEELNEYSDKTIYSFSDMTESIGKFTNAGVSLDDAVMAIKGISNEAAVSGANANEASRAMYNFAQALSAGHVKLIDWKSIENANMATVEFKNQLLESAVAAGTLERASDGMYRVLSTNANGDTMDELINATTMFNDSLTYQWMTTDTLVGTLKTYADETTDIGKKAFAAAQDVKTFSMMMDSLKEAAGSGWAQTWEILIGDLEEAKVFWTNINNVLSNFIGGMSDSRNNLLKGWKDLGGRDNMIASLSSAFSQLGKVMTIVKESFREIFPPITSKQLFNITKNIGDLIGKLKITDETADKLRRTFKGVFSALDIVKDVIFGFGNGLSPVIGFLGKMVDGFLSITASAGDYVSGLREVISRTELFKKIVEDFGNFVKPIGDLFSKAADKVKSFFDSLTVNSDGIDSVVEKINNGFRPFTALGQILEKVFNWFSGVLSKVTHLVSEGLSNLGTAVVEGVDSPLFNKLVGLLNGGLISAILFGLKSIVDNLKGITEDGGGILSPITGILDGVKDCLDAYQKQIKAGIIKSIAISLAILAGSILMLAMIDPTRLASSLVGMGGLMTEMYLFMKVFEKLDTKTLSKGTGAIISLSIGILFMSSALKKLADLQWDEIGRGLTSMAGGLAIMIAALKVMPTDVTKKSADLFLLSAGLIVLGGALKIMSTMSWDEIARGLTAVAGALAVITLGFKMIPSDVTKKAIDIHILSGSLIVLGGAMKIFGTISWDSMIRGLVSLSGSLTVLAIALKRLPSDVTKKAADLTIVSGSLIILGAALKILGTMSWDSILRSLTALGGALVILAIGVRAMGGTISGATAIAVLSASLLLLAPALLLLGSMSLTEIGLAVLALAGAFTVLGIAGLVIAPLTIPLLGLAGAIALLGVGCLAAGAGVLALSAGLGMLTVVGAASIQSFISLVVGLIGLIPAFIKKIGEGVVEFARAISDGAPAIAESVFTIMKTILQTIVRLTPMVVEGILELLTSLLTTISEHVPEFVEAACNIIIGFIEGISSKIGDIISAGYDIVVNLLNAMSEKTPEVVEAGFNMVVSVVEGIADSCEENLPRIVAAADRIFDAFVNAGKQVLTNSIENFTSIGSDIVSGIVNGLKSGWDWATETISNIASGLLETAKDVLGINSPSKEFAEVGMWIDEGFAQGLLKYASVTTDAASLVGNSTIDTMRDLISSISVDDLDASPVIRPVVDLSSVESGADLMNNMLGGGRNLAIDASINSARRASAQMRGLQNGVDGAIVSAIQDLKKSISGAGGVTYNSINGITYDDGSNISNAVRDIVRAAKIGRRV